MLKENILEGTVGIDLDVVKGKDAFAVALDETLQFLKEDMLAEYERRKLDATRLN